MVWTKRLLMCDFAILALVLLTAFVWGAVFGVSPIRFEGAAPRQYGWEGGVTALGVALFFLLVPLAAVIMERTLLAVLLAVVVGAAGLGLAWADRRRQRPGPAGRGSEVDLWFRLVNLAAACVAVGLALWPLVVLGFLVL